MCGLNLYPLYLLKSKIIALSARLDFQAVKEENKTNDMYVISILQFVYRSSHLFDSERQAVINYMICLRF